METVQTRKSTVAVFFRSKKFNVRLYTCNYGEAGNILRRKMYKVKIYFSIKIFYLHQKIFSQVGAACEHCPCGTACSDQYPGLCSAHAHNSTNHNLMCMLTSPASHAVHMTMDMAHELGDMAMHTAHVTGDMAMHTAHGVGHLAMDTVSTNISLNCILLLFVSSDIRVKYSLDVIRKNNIPIPGSQRGTRGHGHGARGGRRGL